MLLLHQIPRYSLNLVLVHLVLLASAMGQWSTPANLSASGQSAYTSQVAVDGSGNVENMESMEEIWKEIALKLTFEPKQGEY